MDLFKTATASNFPSHIFGGADINGAIVVAVGIVDVVVGKDLSCGGIIKP